MLKHRLAGLAFTLAAGTVHAQTVPDGIDCRDIPGAGSLLSGHKIVMVGEQHGTQEMPATFARLVCAALNVV